MDVSTDILNDPKFRRVQREDATHVAPAFMAYVAVVAESWKAGQRVAVTDAWPVLLPFDSSVVATMKKAELLDSRGQVPVKSWNGWFKEAFERREKTRERWRRANERRATDADSRTKVRADAATLPRGDGDDAARIHRRSRPNPNPNPNPNPIERDSPPPPAERGRRAAGTSPRERSSNPRAKGTSARQNGASPRQGRDAEKHGDLAPSELERIEAERARYEKPVPPDELEQLLAGYHEELAERQRRLEAGQ